MKTDEAARILKYSQNTVRQLLRDGTLTGKKIGPRFWDVDAKSIDEYLRTYGGPKKEKPAETHDKPCTVEFSVEIDAKLVQIEYDFAPGGAVYAREIRIPVESQHIIIQDIQLITSNLDISYRLMFFMHLPPGDHLPQDEPEDVLQMKLVTQRAYYWKGPLPYENLDGGKFVMGALCLGAYPVSFGDSYPYPKDAEPIRFRIRMSYSLV